MAPRHKRFAIDSCGSITFSLLSLLLLDVVSVQGVEISSSITVSGHLHRHHRWRNETNSTLNTMSDDSAASEAHHTIVSNDNHLVQKLDIVLPPDAFNNDPTPEQQAKIDSMRKQFMKDLRTYRRNKNQRRAQLKAKALADLEKEKQRTKAQYQKRMKQIKEAVKKKKEALKRLKDLEDKQRKRLAEEDLKRNEQDKRRADAMTRSQVTNMASDSDNGSSNVKESAVGNAKQQEEEENELKNRG